MVEVNRRACVSRANQPCRGGILPPAPIKDERIWTYGGERAPPLQTPSPVFRWEKKFFKKACDWLKFGINLPNTRESLIHKPISAVFQTVRKLRKKLLIFFVTDAKVSGDHPDNCIVGVRRVFTQSRVSRKLCAKLPAPRKGDLPSPLAVSSAKLRHGTPNDGSRKRPSRKRGLGRVQIP